MNTINEDLKVFNSLELQVRNRIFKTYLNNVF